MAGISEPGATSLCFEVLNSFGEPLKGTFHTRGVKPSTCSPYPDAVVLCHGFRSSQKSSTLTAISDGLRLPTALFDFSGNGESAGKYGNYSKEVDDLRTVVSWLRDTGFNVKGLLGHSKGGNVVLLYGAMYDDVDRIVNLCGRYDLHKGVKERIGEEGLRTLDKNGIVQMDGYEITLEGLRERLSTDMSSVQRIKRGSVLHVHGSDDAVSPVAESLTFKEKMPNSQLVIVDGADHGFRDHRSELVDAVVPFLEGESGNTVNG